MHFLLWLHFWIFVPWHTHLRVYAKLLSRCFIFLLSIQNKQVHSLNTESSIIANIFTQISFLFVLGYSKIETPDSVWPETLHKIPETRDPGPKFFLFSQNFHQTILRMLIPAFLTLYLIKSHYNISCSGEKVR